MADHPVRVDGRLDATPSRWLWLVKWLLILPHLIVLVFLWAAFALLALVAFVSVAFRGRLPRGVFEFNVGVLRWSWRVGFYAYGALGTDRYPPFTLADVPDYPARLEIEYPQRLPRGWSLIGWWFRGLPHYVVACALVGSGPWLAADAGWAAPGVIGLIAVMAGVVLLFTGRYPEELFGALLGFNRWVLRTAAYAAVLTDERPPFRLDTVGGPAVEAPVAVAARGGGGGALLATGAIAALFGLGALFAGGAMLAVDATQRDADGFLETQAERYETGTFALTAAPDELHLDGPEWLDVADLTGDVRLRAEADRPVFVGIARTRDVRAYLEGVAHEEVRDIGGTANAQRLRPGGAPAAPPAESAIWVAQGENEVVWEPRSGVWSVLVMNDDASRDVRVTVRAGAELPALRAAGLGVLVAGLLMSAAAVALLVAGARRRG